jgi:Domain of unknown function (DUF4132)
MSVRDDEDTWAVPGTWWRQVEPFRGRSPRRPVEPDPATVRTVDELLAAAEARFEPILDHPGSDPELTRCARLYLETRRGLRPGAQDDPSPLGAAVVGEMLSIVTNYDPNTRVRLADHWVGTHGHGFAAETGVSLATVSREYPPGLRAAQRRNTSPAIVPWAVDEAYPVAIPVLTRLRELLAAADDGSYRDAVERVGALRTRSLGVRLAASYLLPTEQEWLDEVVEQIPKVQLSVRSASASWLAPLLASATRLDQAEVILDTATVWWVVQRSGALHSLAAYAGPDAAPIFARVFDDVVGADNKKRALAMLGHFPTDAAFDLLLERLDQKYVQPVALEAMARFPHRAMRRLAAAAAGSDARAALAKELLRGHLITHPDDAEAARALLDARSVTVLDQVLDQLATATPGARTAGEEELPAVLVSPPWTAREGRRKRTVVAGLTSATPTTLVWKPGEEDEWATSSQDLGPRATGDDDGWTKMLRFALSERGWPDAMYVFAFAPVELVRPYPRTFTPTHISNPEALLPRILGRLGDDAIDFVMRIVLTRPVALAGVLMPLEGSELARRMADWYTRSKSIRPTALAWFERHAAPAARDLIPLAVGRPGKERANAEAALRALDQRGHGAVVRATAANYGNEVAAAMDACLAVDPLQLLPARVPTTPAWLDPAHLPQVLLRDRRAALPPSAVGHLCTMFAISKPGDIYAGIDVVRDAVDPASLADMAWSVFERWQGAGYPAREGWALDALGLVGDDDTVRRLAPLIQAWPGESAHKRAVAGIDILTSIGTDAALMYLHRIAEKAKFKGLKATAKARMEEVADGLGLTTDQLGDRLVPDFELDQDGSLVLDYGERRFRVGFDEQLKPTVADEDGGRRKALPKPGAKDDPSLAPAAFARFGSLKKDVRAVAGDQIRRFEKAMVTGRRWTAAEQRSLFVEHPLLWHLTRRLVWATFTTDGTVLGSFRVAEDRTLADSADDEITVTDDAVVGIAHPFHLGDTIAAWSALFADYEVLQPFPQLAREVFALTDDERKATVLARFAGIRVPTGKILGLSQRGWQRGAPQDAGIQGVTFKPVAEGRSAVIDLDPGIVAGEAMEWPEQTITGVWLSDQATVEWGNPTGDLTFDRLDPITASEVLRDVEGLVP